jgi:hypothetical protein
VAEALLHYYTLRTGAVCSTVNSRTGAAVSNCSLTKD